MNSCPRIYYPENLALNTTVSLAAQASKHLISVLRLQIDDTLVLFNGQGGQYACRLSSTSRGRGIFQALVDVQDYTDIDIESPLHIHLAQAISRSDKMDYVIQKAVELGVSDITPLMTERTVVKLSAERLQSKILHWQQVIISACEQCGRNRIPTLHAAVHFNDWIKKSEKGLELKLVLAPQAQKSLGDFQVLSENVVILIGAEGGFSDEEIEAAEQNQFISLRLGPRVLRTETAALAMVAALQVYWGDFR